MTVIDIAMTYKRACETPSDIYEHLPYLHEIGTRATVIELGVRSGVSSAAFLAAGADLWSCDVDGQPYHYEGWNFIQGDDMSIPVMQSLPERCDVLFIDTSHWYKHTVAELALYGPRVNRGGLIVLHDTELQHPDGEPDGIEFPVKAAMENYCFMRGFQHDNRENCYGLGVIFVE